jgi:CheY-like chemotaxis protein
MLLQGLRILVVDDYESLRFLKTLFLSKAGAEVLSAGTGGEACRLLEKEKIDLVLMDVNLPDMQGPEVARVMRASPASVTVKVIYTSASELDGKLEPGEVFLQEPLDRQTLVDAVRKLTGR